MTERIGEEVTEATTAEMIHAKGVEIEMIAEMIVVMGEEMIVMIVAGMGEETIEEVEIFVMTVATIDEVAGVEVGEAVAIRMSHLSAPHLCWSEI